MDRDMQLCGSPGWNQKGWNKSGTERLGGVARCQTDISLDRRDVFHFGISPVFYLFLYPSLCTCGIIEALHSSKP